MDSASVTLDCRYNTSANANLDTWIGLPHRKEVNPSIFTPNPRISLQNIQINQRIHK